MSGTPRRIVCLTAETAEVLYRLGAADRVVGVSCYAPRAPDGVKRSVVSVFTTIYYDVVESLRPDLILAFSDLQAEAARELGSRGYSVLLTNQRTLGDVLETILLLGRVVDRARQAADWVSRLERRLNKARAEASRRVVRPTVYFEEWNNPLITGIAWVGELIEAAGGWDAFAELRDKRCARDRIVAPETVLERRPDLVIASWCGKRVRPEEICNRPGWSDLPAVRDGEVHEVASAHCLQPGPVLFTEGLPRFQEIVRRWYEKRRSRAAGDLTGEPG